MATTALANVERDPFLEERVTEVAANTDLWQPLVQFTEPRLRLSLHEDDIHEVRLLTWGPGQGSGLHDHGGSAGCFLVLRGCVWETIVDPDGRTHEFRHEVGHIGSFTTDIVHDVRNEGSEGAVTLHAYRPAITRMTAYVLDGGVLRVAEVQPVG